ncbi:acyl-CoA dehydrogenase [Acrocarpospora corrugata]|uniref:Acyl-CoA dehydrogenase n=1 Tax=Acrocarpospora corrugata TaxID=35763 RepID=A0A5M3VTJ6_9ACTN|nr:acyl-CoA dehydrogenase family protein [Acrocarpospora corrugata]GES00127.1 acyl-CoA dehydrogenase [Acrocarpospora corrugata]
MDALRAVVRRFLSAEPDAPWSRFAGELGVAGLCIPEEYGGAGAGFIEVAVVSEELGRVLSPLPYLATVVLATSAILQSGNADAHARLLPDIAAGKTTATVVFPEDADLHLDRDRLTGTAPYVADGDLVLAYVNNVLVEAIPTQRKLHSTLDHSRPLATLRFDAAPARPLGLPGPPVREIAIAGLAAEQVGGAARCLESTLAHVKSRHQFERPIGSFQALKHRLADLYLQVESARSAAQAAAAAPGDPVRAAVAGSYCTETYLAAAAEQIQLHGGPAITWDHPAHRYFKRATSDAQLFGTPQAHRARLAALVL